jgi:hypothetical protein
MSFRISGKDSIAVAIPVLRRPVGFRASAAPPLVTRRANGSAHQRAKSLRVTHFSISLIGIFALKHDRTALRDELNEYPLALRLPSPRRALLLFTNRRVIAKITRTSYHES